nr:PepSY domain-containing protein [Hyphomicrobium sp.]
MNSRWYNAVWRWHFYAGLFCVPFVIWLSCTGAIYLWRPQIEAWLERPYNALSTSGSLASPDAQVSAALSAVPGSQLRKYFLPQSPSEATRILVSKDGVVTRAYVDPRSLAVLKVEEEEARPFRTIFHLHGELLAGYF